MLELCRAESSAGSSTNAVLDRSVWIRRVLMLDPDNLQMRYNLACVLVLEIADDDAALDALQPLSSGPLGSVSSAILAWASALNVPPTDYKHQRLMSAFHPKRT